MLYTPKLDALLVKSASNEKELKKMRYQMRTFLNDRREWKNCNQKVKDAFREIRKEVLANKDIDNKTKGNV